MSKTEVSPQGWAVTTTETFRIKLIKRNFSSLSSWIAFNKKNPDIGKRRLSCNCCHAKWEDMPATSEIHICMMESKHVNQVICDKCLPKFDQSLIINP